MPFLSLVALLLGSGPAQVVSASQSIQLDCPAVTRSRTVSVRGLGPPKTTVSLGDESRRLTVLRTDGEGRFEFTGVHLHEGANRLLLRVFVGEDSPLELIREVLCDTVAPPLDVTGPAEGALSRTAEVEFSGAAEGGATVIVRDGTEQCCRVEVAADGLFRVATGSLTDGLHELTVVSRDAAGNETTVRRGLFVDTTPPPVRIVSPGTGVLTRRTRLGVRSGRVHGVSINVLIQSEPRSTVDLLVNNEGRGTIETGADGKARFLNIALPLTQIWLDARAVDAAGNTGYASRVWLGQPKF